MGARWRRPFCTSIRRDPEATPTPSDKRSLSPRICAKLGGLFSGGGGGGGSNPSTPRMLSRTAPSTPSLRCRTIPDSPKAVAAIATPPPARSLMDPKRSPKQLLQASSEPCSPRSPSRFALFKAGLRFSRNRCGVCSQSVRTGAAVFTAECSHAFHLACIASHVTSCLVCPVCSATWRRSPLLPSTGLQADDVKGTTGGGAGGRRPTMMRKPCPLQQQQQNRIGPDKVGTEAKPVAAGRLYDDDEPLLPLNTLAGRFNPIPEEADGEEDDSREEEGALRRIFPTEETEGHPHRAPAAPQASRSSGTTGIEVSVMPEAALVSAGRSHRNYVVALKVRAPPPTSAAVPLLDPSRRAPIDLVTVLDVRGTMSGDKLHVLKRAMRHLITSMGPADRLCIVAFSASAAKRLLPLYRMSRQGQRSARHIVDRLILSTAAQGNGGGADALRKATKVLEDRRERNPVATIMLLSDGPNQQQMSNVEKIRNRTPVGATRFAHLEVPISKSEAEEEEEEEEDPFTKCVLGGLLSVLFQDVDLRFAFPAGEISAVYSCGAGSSGRAIALGGGNSVRLGHLHAGEERELLVELRVPVGGAGPQHHALSVRCSYRDASTHELICSPEQPLPMPLLQSSSGNPHPQFLRSNSSLNVQRLRNLFVATRAVAESRRLADLHDLATAVHLLSSARSLLLQSTTVASDKNLIQSLDAELADLQRLRLQQPPPLSPPLERTRGARAGDDGREPLTPTSAWRAAEQLAKLAIMRKSMNRVGDLHGFESARF